MKTIAISVVVMFVLVIVAAAQNPATMQSAGADLLAAVNGDMVRFERGMRALEELLSKNPNDPAAKVLHGNGVMVRAGESFKTGDAANATRLWQTGIDEMALSKLERLRGTAQAQSESEELRAIARELTRKYPERIASRLGERVVFVEVGNITHFYAKDKLTYAATASKDYVIDATISDLEEKLDPALFLRIHRATLLNLDFVDEVNAWFGGGLVVRLKDGKRTELQIARDRLREVKDRLEF